MNTTCLQPTEKPYKAVWPVLVHSYAVKDGKMEDISEQI